jgi:hypothetical protein
MRNTRPRSFVVLTSVSLWLVFLGAAVTTASAQDAFAGWPDKKFEFEKSEKLPFPELHQVLTNGAFDDATQEAKFADHFRRDFFPRITRLDNRQSEREDVIRLLRGYLRTARQSQQQQVFNRLVDLTLEYMTAAAQNGKINPACRVNAILAIGELNSPKAAQVLLDTVRRSFKKGEAFALGVAAMNGLVRLASKGSISEDPEVSSRVVSSMVILTKLPNKRFPTADGGNWMRGQAADVLAEIGSAVPAAEAAPALLIMLNDTEVPIPLRTKAARALGKINYSSGLPAAGPYLQALAAFVNEALGNADQAGNHARIRQIVRDVAEIKNGEVVEGGIKPFVSSSNASDAQIIEEMKKTLSNFLKETEPAMSAEELKTAVTKAKSEIDGLIKK